MNRVRGKGGAQLCWVYRRMHIRLRQMCIREWSRVRRLGRLHVLGARTLGALADLERHSLSFAK